MPPEGGTVRVAICQDGRQLHLQSDLTYERDYFRNLYNDRKYLDRRDIQVDCYAVSFVNQPIVQQHLSDMDRCDIFFMTGFSPGTDGLSPQLGYVFENHRRMGDCERDTSNMMENLYRKLVARVQYNQMVYMGTCGGAMVAGRYYWNIRQQQFEYQMKMFDFLMGVSLRYDPCMSCVACDASAVINVTTLYMTRGAGVAVHIQDQLAQSSQFPTLKNNIWWDWCENTKRFLQDVVRSINLRNVSGPWTYPGYKNYMVRVNGSAFYV